MRQYWFIHAERATYPITLLCGVLHVARSAYYDRTRRGVSARAQAEAELLAQIAAAHALLSAIAAAIVIADKGYDTEARVLAPLREAGKAAVIPPKRNCTAPRDYDRDLYRARHLIEHFFCKLKQYPAIATPTTRRNATSSPPSTSPRPSYCSIRALP